MGRLIEADRLKEVFSRNVVGGNAYFDLIDNAPTVAAITLDKIKQAREEMEIASYLKGYDEVLEILDKLIESEDP